MYKEGDRNTPYSPFSLPLSDLLERLLHLRRGFYALYVLGLCIPPLRFLARLVRIAPLRIKEKEAPSKQEAPKSVMKRVARPGIEPGTS